LPRVRNFHVAVREWNDQIIFLHKVRPGGTDRSYGIQVARVAGLPETVIARARAILADLERERATLAPSPAVAPAEGVVNTAVQLGLFPAARDPLLEALAAVDLEGLTPLAALNLLADWQRALRERPS
jgi:DNA mismatch repair protein MutS